MMRVTRPLLLMVFAIACIGSARVAVAGEPPFSFARHYIDTNYGGSGKPGWVRAGDMDGDGDLDIVAGGGRALFVYENDGNGRGWRRFGSLDGTGEMGANGAALMDVDGDGDLDVVCARYKKELGWWENPGGGLGRAKGTVPFSLRENRDSPQREKRDSPQEMQPWGFHTIDDDNDGWFAHDVELFDIDGDGRAEELVVSYQKGYWDAPARILWYRVVRRGGISWQKHTVAGNHPGRRHCHAGLHAGDVDGDGRIDLAYSNGWFEAPNGPGGTWKWHPVGDVYGISNVRLHDMDHDGDLDLIMSAGHHGTGVYWYANPGRLGDGKWWQHTVDASIRNPEGLAVVDLDKDGRAEVVACELDFDHWEQPRHHVYVFSRAEGRATGWRKQNVAPGGYASHQLVAVDINRDGRKDIISEGCGYAVVTYYENTTPRRQ